MLTVPEQSQILAKVDQILAYERRHIGRVERGEISKKTFKNTVNRLRDELRDLLKEAG